MPKSQSERNTAYRKRVGIISKSFTLEKKLCDDFKEACANAGMGQAAAITAFMKDFIKKHGSK